jgi:acyl-CoA reductase-like NAD-dependent aldehyde dehydrogenase
MTIDGKAVPTLATFGVDNPATGEIFAEAPECSRDQLDLAMTVRPGPSSPGRAISSSVAR